MRHLSLERHVPHPPGKMFDLVADLASYPRFLPNVSAMEVRPSGDAQLAQMTVRYGPFSDSYTSRVEADRATLTVRAKSNDGPFQFLDSTWTFEPEGQGTCVRFEIQFAFGNKLIAAVAEPAFASKQDQILDAFLREAARRYRAA